MQKRAKKLKVNDVAKQQLLQAMAWCAGTRNGAKAAVAWLEKQLGSPPTITRNQIDYAHKIQKKAKVSNANTSPLT